MAKSRLSLYQQKRDFTKTAEPSGKSKVAPAQYPRFVIQKHAARRLHYDLRLEVDGVFKSWAVTKGPSLDPKDKRLAVQTEDHPLDYGDFEGTIPAGEYGGGTVMLWDRGFWASDGDPAKSLAKGELRFTLAGEKLQGSWVLVRLRHDREGGKRTNWLLIKRHDGFEREGDGESVLDQDRSVAWPVMHAFRKRDGKIFHFWGTETMMNHVDTVWPYWNLMDFTPEGRPERDTPPQRFRSEFLEKNYLNK
jgi:bifunctional non-homologous end joining protein LigD